MITAIRSEDRSTWLRWWLGTGREPFAHPDYVRLFAEDENHEALLLVVEQSAGAAVLPIICRPLPTGARAGRNLAGWVDAVSPYGYGGPYVAGQVAWYAFYRSVIDWMKSEKVVACFIRQSLQLPAIPEDVDLPGYRAVELSENVVVDCTRSREGLWKNYAHKVRKNVNKATRAGLAVRVSERLDDLGTFMDIYRSTMRRRSAEERYYFDHDFFTRVGSIPESIRVFDVLDADGRVVSSELVLVSDRYFYSFLGGTLEEAFVFAPNDLLKHAVVEQAQLEGKQGYVLGGGYEAGDGIFRYKRSFDPSGVLPFVGIQLIGDADLYSQLVSNARSGSGRTDASPQYFPAYRADANWTKDASDGA